MGPKVMISHFSYRWYFQDLRKKGFRKISQSTGLYNGSSEGCGEYQKVFMGSIHIISVGSQVFVKILDFKLGLVGKLQVIKSLMIISSGCPGGGYT